MAYVMRGIKRGNVLIYNGFRYQKNRKTKEKIHWRCWRKSCRVRLVTNLFDMAAEAPNINIEEFEEHDHAADEDIILQGHVFNQMRETIESDPTRPIKRTYDKVIHDVMDDSDHEIEELPDFSNVRTRLQRVRSSLLPPLPHEVDDVEIEGEWTKTWSKKQFLSHHDNDWGILIFATRENYRILERCDTIYIDGTFKTCPKPYTQFVTIHGKFQDRIVLLVMALLTNKTVGIYRQLLQHVKTKVRTYTGHRWRPGNVVCHFENSLKIAIETELPRSRVQTCYFHFCQSIWRKVQELGLAQAYKRRRRVRKLIRKFMAIGHLPVMVVRQNFNLLANGRSTRRLINRYPAILDFINYVENTYINGLYPIPIWNVYNRDKDCRTNNIVEGFHSRWNTSVGRKHPSLWIFIRKLKDEERLERQKIRSIRQGRLTVKPKRKWRKLEKRIKKLKRQYQLGVRTLDEYWAAITYCVKDYN